MTEIFHFLPTFATFSKENLALFFVFHTFPLKIGHIFGGSAIL